MEHSIQYANSEDVPLLVDIINQSYRGEKSKLGWTTEAFFIEGEKRTDHNDLLKHIGKEQAVMLKAVRKDNIPDGCVYLEKQGNKLYLGMLSVKPHLQQHGIGKLLMKAAEAYAIQHGITTIMMYVISLRTELIAWYEKQGYRDTGQRSPFPDVPEFGKPIQPLAFIVMEKELK